MVLELQARAPSIGGAPPVGGAGSPALEMPMPAARLAVPAAVQGVVDEMAAMVGEGAGRGCGLRGRRRRSAIHRRQIAMYVTHVVLQFSLTELGCAFGRDRTTVGHACNVVEDRRDDPAYDRFVTGVERIVAHIFTPCGAADA